MSAFLAAAKPVVVQVQEASGGASIESILVFIGGVLAATGAVAAAIITTRGASSRLEQQLANERQRFDKQLAAEVERFDKQFAHDRYLTRRAEVSSSVEQISRTIARNYMHISAFVGRSVRGKESSSEQLKVVHLHLNELMEEVNVLTIRFGNEGGVSKALAEVVEAMQLALPGSSELPLSEQRKQELQEAQKKISRTNANFLVAARKALEDY